MQQEAELADEMEYVRAELKRRKLYDAIFYPGWKRKRELKAQIAEKQDHLDALDGVEQAVVSRDPDRVRVTGTASEAAVRAAIVGAGFTPT